MLPGKEGYSTGCMRQVYTRTEAGVTKQNVVGANRSHLRIRLIHLHHCDLVTFRLAVLEVAHDPVLALRQVHRATSTLLEHRVNNPPLDNIDEVHGQRGSALLVGRQGRNRLEVGVQILVQHRSVTERLQQDSKGG